MNQRTVKWANIIPLVGGSAFGCYNATGVLPEYHLSYSAFDANEKPLQEYWKEVPRILLDEGAENIPETKIDFVNTVCPCAGLSMLSTAKDRETRDKSNKWMLESADVILGKVKPRVFWGENAPTLFTNMGTWVRESLVEKAEKYGYSFSLYKTSTSLHGIPQNRNRTFYFFWKSETAPIMNYYNRPKKKFAEYLEEIPADSPNQDEYNNNKPLVESCSAYEFALQHLGLSHGDFVKLHGGSGSVHSIQTFLVENNILENCIRWMEENKGESKELNRLKKILEKVNAGGRFMDGSPQYFLDTCNALVGRNLVNITHPEEARYLTIREICHMMGMPHDFNFSTKDYNLNILAQNVPSSTSRDMTLEVVKFLNGELPMSEEKLLFQDNFKQRIRN